MKNFHKASFLWDLHEKAWSDVEILNDPNVVNVERYAGASHR